MLLLFSLYYCSLLIKNIDSKFTKKVDLINLIVIKKKKKKSWPKNNFDLINIIEPKPNHSGWKCHQAHDESSSQFQ